MNDAVLLVDELGLAGLANAAVLQHFEIDVVEIAFVAVELELQAVAAKDVAHLVEADVALGRQGVAGLVVPDDVALEHIAGLAHFGMASRGNVTIDLAVEAIAVRVDRKTDAGVALSEEEVRHDRADDGHARRDA